MNYDYSKLDFSVPIDRSSLNPEIYNSKFAAVNSFVANPSDAGSELLLQTLLSDITSFSYLNFRLDGAPLSLYSYQDIILNDPYRFILFRASNQIGKSISLDVDGVYNFVLDHGKGYNAAIVSKSLPQATHQMRRIKGLLTTANFEWTSHKGISDNMYVISFDVPDEDGKTKYTNLLICAPCTEGLLGYDLHKLYLDEFEFWDVDTEYFFNQIAEPRTYHTKGKIMIFSNPNGADSYGAELEELQYNSGKRKFHTYSFNFLDKPGNTEQELEDAKAGKTRQQIESTLLAIRSLSDRSYLTSDEIEGSYDPKLQETSMVGKHPIFFLDVGAKHDQSCLIGGYVEVDPVNERLAHLHMPIIHLYPVGYPMSRVVGSIVDGSDGWHHEKSVKEHLEEWSVDGIRPTFGVDVTGNSGIVPLFESIGIEPQDVMFSGPSKSGYYQRFKYFMEKKLLHRVKHKVWEKQAADLIVTKGMRGYLLINAASASGKGGKSMDAKLKRIPDDCMDATVGFIHLADPRDYAEPTFKLI